MMRVGLSSAATGRTQIKYRHLAGGNPSLLKQFHHVFLSRLRNLS